MNKHWSAANHPSKKVVVVQTVTFEGDEDAVAFLLNNNAYRSNGVTKVDVRRSMVDNEGNESRVLNVVTVGCITTLPRYLND